MKVHEFCEGFAWLPAVKTSFFPSADSIIIQSVRTEDNNLYLRLCGDTTNLLFSLPNAKSAEKLCDVLRAHLMLDGPLSLRQLGDIDLYFS
jgi:hypothetical protein